jgi:hypothetical protein
VTSHDWAEIIGTVGIFAFFTTIVSIVIVQVFATWRAKAHLAREAEYRTLAETAVSSQVAVEKRLAEIERILKDVE